MNLLIVFFLSLALKTTLAFGSDHTHIPRCEKDISIGHRISVCAWGPDGYLHLDGVGDKLIKRPFDLNGFRKVEGNCILATRGSNKHLISPSGILLNDEGFDSITYDAKSKSFVGERKSLKQIIDLKNPENNNSLEYRKRNSPEELYSRCVNRLKRAADDDDDDESGYLGRNINNLISDQCGKKPGLSAKEKTEKSVGDLDGHKQSFDKKKLQNNNVAKDSEQNISLESYSSCVKRLKIAAEYDESGYVGRNINSLISDQCGKEPSISKKAANPKGSGSK